MTTGVKCVTRVWAGNAGETAASGAMIAGAAGKDAAMTGTDVEYDGALGAVILRPAHRDSPAVMAINDWQASGWQEKDGCLEWQSAAASALTAVNQHTGSPWVLCRVTRGNNAAEWTLTWGGNRVLVFSTRRPPYVSVNGNIAATLPMNPSEYHNYVNADDICWEIRDYAGDLYITCSAFSRIWLIPGAGNIPAGNLRLSADGTTYSVLLFAMTFPQTGSFYTAGAVNNPDYAGVLPVDENVQISTGGARHQITLTGDGSHTPAVRGWNIFRRPANTDFTGEWQEISEKLIGGHLEYSLDSATANLTFTDFPAANRVKISQMMELADGRIRSIERPAMAVVKKERRITGAGITMRVTAVSQQGMLAEKMAGEVPPLCGMPVDEAIAVTAEWAGVKNIKIWQDASENSIENAGWWGNRGGDAAINEYLNAPAIWRGEIPWRINNENVWNFIKMLANMYGLRVWFEGDELQIRRANAAYPADITEYSVNYGTDSFNAPAGIAITSNTGGKSIAVRYISENGMTRIAGDAGAETVVNCPPDITTADAAERYVGYVKSLLNSTTEIMMTGRTALWNRSPGDAIILTGTGDDINGILCRATQLNISLTEPYRAAIRVKLPGENGIFTASAAEIERILNMRITSPAEINGIVCGTQNISVNYFTIGVSAIAGNDRIK